GDMLDKGSTTAWETFSGFDGRLWTRSWCHAWAALPAYILPTYVLGVRPLEPGFSRALIAPQLGDLTWAEGRVPTPHGPIAVRLDKDGQGLNVELALPPGVVAEVRLSVGARSPAVFGAEAQVDLVGGEYVITLPAGAQVGIAY